MPNQLFLLVPGDPATPTGGYIYDRRIADGLRYQGWQAEMIRLDDSFPAPTRAALDDAAAKLAALPDQALVMIDGLALGAMPDQVARERDRLRLIGLVHHPLALETGLDPVRAEALRKTEMLALSAMGSVIVTSPATARLLRDFGVDPELCHIVEPGTDPAPLATGSGHGPPRLLSVGAITPRKGHRLLIAALATLTHLDWQLDCVGSLDRDPGTTAALRRQIAGLELEPRVRLVGTVDADALAAAYHRADLFVLPSLFEGYGMAYAEAVARGLPIIGTNAGAIPDTVPADAALLVEPGSVPSLTRALEQLLTNRATRHRLAAGARRARVRLPDWPTASRRMARALADSLLTGSTDEAEDETSTDAPVENRSGRPSSTS
jgi:glycosyltransferase involved in cell wall biosynthesis